MKIQKEKNHHRTSELRRWLGSHVSVLRTGFGESDHGKAKVKGGGLFILNLE